MNIVAASRLLRAAVFAGMALGASVAPAWAQEQPSAAVEQTGDVEPKQVPLNGKLVESFLAAWPEFDKLREKLAAQNPQTKAQENSTDQPESDEAEVGEAEDPIGALASYLDKPEAKAEIDAILKKHQFATYSDWADVAQSVLLAFGASDPEGGDTDLAEEKKKVQAEIQNDAALSEDEKQAALKDLDEQFAALESFQPLPGNVEAVKPYVAKIKALFGEDEN
ncbi:hypothetical protein JOD31_000559 [Methylopila capsulata]|uniref:Uncharacterized protein n=1 Tax=Methylopila capsulata TaxID=61654 RepID=A0A9W6IUQ5_9HYPH|nr:hypothetical protein [Methylopila capsulata]MBM7850347.1 hypothetical protein [Methylopila capsulata]GLK55640.1 hypothetical protein GCM10008170_16590 [Methylopila capsulata]